MASVMKGVKRVYDCGVCIAFLYKGVKIRRYETYYGRFGTEVSYRIDGEKEFYHCMADIKSEIDRRERIKEKQSNG